MRVVVLLGLLVVVAGCGRTPLEWTREDLSDVLSITNLSRQPVYNAETPPSVIGLRVQADVVNTGIVTIDVPFDVTWSLLNAQGKVYASASQRIEDAVLPGERRRVSLVLEFSAIPGLEGYREAVTFDLVAVSSSRLPGGGRARARAEFA